jgi:hypothetical protein
MTMQSDRLAQEIFRERSSANNQEKLVNSRAATPLRQRRSFASLVPAADLPVAFSLKEVPNHGA